MSDMSLSRAERELIRISASVAAIRHQLQERAHELAIEVDWERLAATLRWRRLLPTLGPRIVEMTSDRSPAAFAGTVDEAIDATRRQATFLQLVSQRMIAALLDARIPCAPLKGPLLGEAIHGDPGRRLSNDVDLLVAPEKLGAAVEVVRRFGYDAPEDYVDDDGLPQLHFLLVHREGTLPPVEVHWRVHPYERRFAAERLLPPAPATGQPGWQPALADQLVALLLFYARDGFVDLRLATDVSAWWDVHSSRWEPGALEEPLNDYPQLRRVVRVAAAVAEKVVGLPSVEVLGKAPRLHVRDRVAMRLANPNPHPRYSQRQLYADIGLVDGLLAPPGGFRAFLRRRVLPPREFLDELDRRAPKRRARSSLGRGAGIVGRFALTMTRLALTPDRALR